MKSAVIFDLDGTLIDSAAMCTHILNGMLRDRGSARSISTEEATPYLSHGGQAMVAGLLGEECGDKASEINEFRRRYAGLPTPPDCLFEGARAALEQLSGCGMKLAICSNKPQNLCEKVIDDLGLARLFDVVIGGAPDRAPKPDRHLLDLTLAELAVDAEQCLFVGDSELDEAIAAAADMPFLCVTYGYAPKDWSTSQPWRFDRLVDLAAVVERVWIRGHRLPCVA